jgi:hypothetical protein
MSISLQTLASFPLTFFLGMIFRATSFAIPLADGPGEGDRDPDFCDVDKLGVGLVLGGSGTDSAAAPRSATAIWSTGTCHVAFYKNNARPDKKHEEER